MVVGAGAAGGVMAKELSTAGFRVVVLEQGPWRREKDFTHDEVGVVARGGMINDPKKQPNTFRKTPAETAKIQPAVGYCKTVGGGSVHFTANYWRFHPEDFHERSVWGPVEGADLRDWPISYDDLEPYYTKAEWDLGISGLGGSNPFDGPRSKPYPLPPMPVKSSGVLAKNGGTSAAASGVPNKLQKSAAAKIHQTLETDRTTFYFSRKLRLPEKSTRSLTPEIWSHDGDVILGETPHQLVLKIIRARCYSAAVTLLKRAAALIDIFF